jgi:hypothetical protein
MKNIVSALAAVAILASAGAAFAADAPAKTFVPKLTKEEGAAIVKECKTANPVDKKAYKICVAEKRKVAVSGKETTAPVAAPVTAPAAQ